MYTKTYTYTHIHVHLHLCGFFLIQKSLGIAGMCTLLDLCCVIAHADECALQLTCTLECKYVTPRLDITTFVGITTFGSLRVGGNHLLASVALLGERENCTEPSLKNCVSPSLPADSFQFTPLATQNS